VTPIEWLIIALGTVALTTTAITVKLVLFLVEVAPQLALFSATGHHFPSFITVGFRQRLANHAEHAAPPTIPREVLVDDLVGGVHDCGVLGFLLGRGYPSGLIGSEESDLGFPLRPESAIQTDAHWYFLHGIFG
jgi:hypothetical protein